MSVDGCLFVLLSSKRNRECDISPEDKILLDELSSELSCTKGDDESEKDFLIRLLKRARVRDDQFNDHKQKDMNNEINSLKGELSAKNKIITEVCNALSVFEKEKERTRDLEREVFRLAKECNEHNKNMQIMRENAIKYNTQHTLALYNLFETHKLQETALNEFNEHVNALFVTPSKFVIIKKL